MTVVGVGVEKSLVRLMRDPVTVISSSVAGAPACAEALSSAGLFCACAVALSPSTRAAVHKVLVRYLGLVELFTAAFTATSIGRITVISGPLPRERLRSQQVNVQAGSVLLRS